MTTMDEGDAMDVDEYQGLTMTRLRGLAGLRGGRGFTLVEMMIAMVLVGILTALIYAMFSRTSDALVEVEERSDALDQARFGLDHVRTGLEAAGAQATPNSEVDPWVVMESGLTVHGVMGYTGWQGKPIDELGTEAIFDELEAANEESRFAGVVVMGAYDMPANFFVSFPDGREEQADADVNAMIVEPTERGTARLRGYDPFDVSVINGVDAAGDMGLGEEDLSQWEDEIAERIFRVTDSEGIAQFMALNDGTTTFDDDGIDGAGRPSDNEFSGLELRLGINNDDLVWSDEHVEAVGFDRAVADDVSFDGALIDAYWFYVRPAPDEPRNFQLIRQRLDAGQVASNAAGLTENDLGGFTRGVPMIIAENVVDFRVWFDCATDQPMGPAHLVEEDWQDEWDVVQGDVSGNCMTDDPNSSEPHRAHYANIRLSTRTERENANRPHYTLPGISPGFESDDGQMRTFALYPDSEGSASVVTVHGGVELTNMTRVDF